MTLCEHGSMMRWMFIRTLVFKPRAATEGRPHSCAQYRREPNQQGIMLAPSAVKRPQALPRVPLLGQ
jgi:hypothetical protein